MNNLKFAFFVQALLLVSVCCQSFTALVPVPNVPIHKDGYTDQMARAVYRTFKDMPDWFDYQIETVEKSNPMRVLDFRLMKGNMYPESIDMDAFNMMAVQAATGNLTSLRRITKVQLLGQQTGLQIPQEVQEMYQVVDPSTLRDIVREIVSQDQKTRPPTSESNVNVPYPNGFTYDRKGSFDVYVDNLINNGQPQSQAPPQAARASTRDWGEKIG
ncbi:hypothetical protein MIR68_003070 [Amoeboaphelidium protococcarum]|nr:hypothetical protein MIR68_003070 [Amoeboaphelidium protococcarum]